MSFDRFMVASSIGRNRTELAFAVERVGLLTTLRRVTNSRAAA